MSGGMGWRRGQSGFTLIELILVIVITGIVGAITAAFIQRPLNAYFDSSRRAALSDAADLALRRMGRELRGALPNSVRVTSIGGDRQLLELVPTLLAGRYEQAAAAACFSSGCSSLRTLGNLIAAANQFAGDYLVIFNYYNNGGGVCAAALPNVYCGDNRAQISASSIGAGQDTFGFAATKRFLPGDSPTHRFQVVGTPVSFVCDTTAGTLTRYWNYGFQQSQPTDFAGASAAVLATGVSGCEFAAQVSGNLQRLGLVSLRLALTSEGETVALYQEVHVHVSP